MYSAQKYFEEVNSFIINHDRLFINRTDSFECYDLDNQLLFEIKAGFWVFTIIGDKMFAQYQNGADLLVFDLNGTLLETFTGNYFLFKATTYKEFLFLPGKENSKKMEYKLNMNLLDKIAPTGLNKIFYSVFNNRGIDWSVDKVYGYDLASGEEAWSFDLGKGNYPEGNFISRDDENVIITTSDSRLISLKSMDGELVWENKTKLKFYSQHPVSQDLYGYGGETYEIIDSKTGTLKLHKRFEGSDEKYGIRSLSSMSKVYEDGLYFISNFSGGKFGKINIENHEIEYVQELNFPSGVSGNIPVSHKDRVYILDSEKRLHVFAKN